MILLFSLFVVLMSQEGVCLLSSSLPIRKEEVSQSNVCERSSSQDLLLCGVSFPFLRFTRAVCDRVSKYQPYDERELPLKIWSHAKMPQTRCKNKRVENPLEMYQGLNNAIFAGVGLYWQTETDKERWFPIKGRKDGETWGSIP